ncbi:4Fe-4S dicluster domain-containing protein [Undibacterium danionis]|uniref:Ferredoxin family protein n=1 Tax=Undibacterium danionis TaxID=1812100 RepID=A0ABV6ILA1_9BURK
MPMVDPNRCEGKGPCIELCPENVFTMGQLARDDYAQLSFKGRIKAWVHGGKQAIVQHPDACLACGQCVVACPEHAVTLVRYSEN